MRRHLPILGAALAALAAAPARAQQPPPPRDTLGVQPGRVAVLTLPDAIAIAQRQSPAARAAESARERAALENRAFRARLLPRLALQGTAPEYNRDIGAVVQPDGTTRFLPRSQLASSLNLALSQPVPVLGGTLSLFSGVSRFELLGRPESRLYSTTPFAVAFTQDILSPRRLVWDSRQQVLQAGIAERRWLEAREDVALTAVGRYFDAWAAQVSAANAANNVAVNDTLYTLNKGRFEVGRIGENDLLQSELALLRARAALDGARLEERRSLAALAATLDLPPGLAIELAPPATFATVVPDTALAVAQALRNRARVTELELEDVVARRELTRARLQNGFNARLVASAGFNRSAGAFDEAYRALDEQQRASLELQLPLWQWGAGRAEVGAARAERERVRHATRQATLELAQEAHFAALQFAQSARVLEIAAKADTVAAKRFEVARQRYVIGRIGVTELYIAQTEKDQAVEGWVRALRAWWRDWHQLRRLTLWDFAAGEPLTSSR